MSVRVNLLPEATRARGRVAQQRNALLLALSLLLLILAIITWMQGNRISEAQVERDEAQLEVSRQQDAVSGLNLYEELASEVDEANASVTQALAGEVSFAGILQDVAVATPNDTALTDIEILRVDEFAVDGQTPRDSVARVLASGESLTGHAPGVERLLAGFERMAGFFDSHVESSASDPEDPDVSLFEVEVDVGEEAETGRYGEDVPEELS